MNAVHHKIWYLWLPPTSIGGSQGSTFWRNFANSPSGKSTRFVTLVVANLGTTASTSAIIPHRPIAWSVVSKNIGNLSANNFSSVIIILPKAWIILGSMGPDYALTLGASCAALISLSSLHWQGFFLWSVSCFWVYSLKLSHVKASPIQNCSDVQMWRMKA